MRSSGLPLTDVRNPATFRSRGVAVPFTAPMLAGARIRAGTHNGPDLVVPNLSGGPGFSVFRWPGVRTLCHPTIHDIVLFQRLAALPWIDPERLHQAALSVAQDGYAGRQAAAAAIAAIAAHREARRRTHLRLQGSLTGQIEPDAPGNDTSLELSTDFGRRAGQALHTLALAINVPDAQLTAGVDALADALAPLGIAPTDRDARIPRLLKRLGETRDAVGAWLETTTAGTVANEVEGLGRFVAAGMTAAHDDGRLLLARIRTVAKDPVSLLRQWVAAPRETLALIQRPSWFLDGWGRMCLLWSCADHHAARRAALLEMAQVMPAMPTEAATWINRALSGPAADHAVRIVSHNDAWRRGAAGFALVQRNEALCALGL